jgi:hypothetical protein
MLKMLEDRFGRNEEYGEGDYTKLRIYRLKICYSHGDDHDPDVGMY